MRRLKGFSLVEILVVVAIIALLIGILLPALSIVRERANRTKSANNLKQIFTAMIGYSTNNNGAYPKYTGTTASNAVGFQTGARGTNNATTVATQASLTNNISAAMWLLVREAQASPALFANPTNTDTPDPLAPETGLDELWDFAGENHFSYSFINFYDQLAGEMWTQDSPPTFVLAGDDNDSGITGSTTSSNSSNHGGAGQNVLFSDGSADWYSTPMAAGSKSDNVYSYFNSSDAETNDGSAATDGSTVQERIDVYLIPVSSLSP